MNARTPVAATILAALVGLFSAEAHAQPVPAAVPNTRFVELSRCRIQPKDHVVLAAERPGILDRVLQEGDTVAGGQVVASLRDRRLRASLRIAQADAANDVRVRYAVKAAQVAEAEYEKALRANRQLAGTVPGIEVERLKLAHERSQLQIEQSRHELAVAQLKVRELRAELASYRLDAPFAGVVTRAYKSPGEAVQIGEPIAEVVGTDILRIEGYADVAQADRLKRGDAVQVHSLRNGDRATAANSAVHGQIVFVDVSVQSVTGEVRVCAEVSNRGNLFRPGLLAHMQISIGRESSADVAAKME